MTCDGTGSLDCGEWSDFRRKRSSSDGGPERTKKGKRVRGRERILSESRTRPINGLSRGQTAGIISS
jgi:hypothetical protein